MRLSAKIGMADIRVRVVSNDDPDLFQIRF